MRPHFNKPIHAALVLTTVLMLIAISGSAQGQTFTILHNLLYIF